MTNTKSSFGGGTLAWTAPEIFASKRGMSQYTVKSDVYSYVLCGAYPESHDGKEASNLPWHVIKLRQTARLLLPSLRCKLSSEQYTAAESVEIACTQHR
eukprot:13650-Heterococcus_DN1.PRE.4